VSAMGLVVIISAGMKDLVRMQLERIYRDDHLMFTTSFEPWTKRLA
jgi:hypothetical protein